MMVMPARVSVKVNSGYGLLALLAMPLAAEKSTSEPGSFTALTTTVSLWIWPEVRSEGPPPAESSTVTATALAMVPSLLTISVGEAPAAMVTFASHWMVAWVVVLVMGP